MSKEYPEADVELETREDHGIPIMSEEYPEAGAELEICEDQRVQKRVRSTLKQVLNCKHQRIMQYHK